MSYKYLYQIGSEADQVYILKSGEVVFFTTNNDKYKISGNNIILGSLEIILSELLNIKTSRLETAVISADAKVTYMKKNHFISEFAQYSYLVNIGKVAAQKIKLTNLIIQKNQHNLLSDKKTLKQLYLEYFKIVTKINIEYKKRKLPWLKDLSKKYNSSLTFIKSEAYSRADVPTKIIENNILKQKTIDLPPNTILCKEGDLGNEMYILQSGTLEVIVNNNQVATLSEPGTVLGELALLLGEVRGATVKSITNIRLTKLKPNDLKEISKKDIKLLLDIICSLAKKYYNNIHLVLDINNAILNKTLNEESGEKSSKQEIGNISYELEKLKYNLDEIIYKQKAEFLKSCIE